MMKGMKDSDLALNYTLRGIANLNSRLFCRKMNRVLYQRQLGPEPCKGTLKPNQRDIVPTSLKIDSLIRLGIEKTRCYKVGP